MDKLFLIDAYALIYRSYYAFIKNPRINSKGFNTSAIMGFCNTIFEVISKEKPTHLGVAFDCGRTFRDDAFEDYKAQRESTPETIRDSVPIIKQILKAMNIPILEAEGYEADDVIGTLALKAGENNVTTYMLTPDKDYGQLVKNNVFIYRPKHGGGYDVLGVKEINEKYSIENPLQLIDILALMGDSADNFPGCPGVGEKTAMRLITQFSSINDMLNRTNELKGKLKENIEAHVEDIKMSQFLATIETKVPIELDLKSLEMNKFNDKELVDIFKKLEFKTLINRWLGKDIINNTTPQADLFSTPQQTQAISNDLFGEIIQNTHKCNVINIETKTILEEIIDKIKLKKSFSFTINYDETPTKQYIIKNIAMCVDDKDVYFFDTNNNTLSLEVVIEELKNVLEDKEILKISHDIKPQIKVLYTYSIYIKENIFDTMVAHYILQPELKHDLSYLIDIVLTTRFAEENKKVINECCAIIMLKKVFEKQLNECNCTKLFNEIEMPLTPILAKMESIGVRIDDNELKKTSQSFCERLNKIEKDIHNLARTEFNISSPKQVGEVLFEQLKIVEKPKKTKTGQYVTSEEVLLQLQSKHEIVDKILKYRALKKLLSTYVDAFPKLINKQTKCIHTTFNQTITATGRLSSSEPNLQNIPIRSEDGREIRRCFVADDNQLFFSADYSQIELRVMAHLSKDKNMIDAFKEGHDIHTATAAKIYHKAINDVTKDERNKAKRANFGIIYGITVFGLAERLNIDRTEAKELIEGYFKTFPQVKEYMEMSIKQAKEQGYAITLFNRRRYLNDINSKNSIVRGFAERNSINAPIQGSAADIIKIAMINISKRFELQGIKAKMILQVHDELNFSVPKDEKQIVESIVKEEMQNAFLLDVPLISDCGWGNNWLEAH